MFHINQTHLGIEFPVVTASHQRITIKCQTDAALPLRNQTNNYLLLLINAF